MKRIVTLLGHDTGLSIVANDSGDKFGVMNEECDMILPFEYDYIDEEMSASGIVMVKQDDKKILIEL